MPKIFQSGEILGDLIGAISQVMFPAGKVAPKLAPALAGKSTEYYINKLINELNKKFT